MKKQIAFVLMICAMLIAVLSACGGTHTHQLAQTWEVDPANHWKTCTDCGEIVEQAAHTLSEDDQCTVCGAQIIDWDDSRSLYLYNDNGDLLKSADYDRDGNLMTETICQYEYDNDGLLIASATTTDGVLVEECTYTAVNGESVIARSISYAYDGTKFINDFDEHGNLIGLISYDAEGNVEYQSASEYAQTADGEWYETKCTYTEYDGTVYVSTYAENHDQIGLVVYDTDGSVLQSKAWERTYDDEGRWQTVKIYNNDVLIEEAIYQTVVDEYGCSTFPKTVTEYHEDGTITVTNYDENGEIIS